LENLSIRQQGTLCLVPFPFSDQTGSKVRPVIIISNNIYNERTHDVIVAAITSKSQGQYRVKIANLDLEIGNLVKDSYIMIDNILRIAQKLILKPFAKLNDMKYRNLYQEITSIFKSNE
jgi:mRNA interferase MazF